MRRSAYITANQCEETLRAGLAILEQQLVKALSSAAIDGEAEAADYRRRYLAIDRQSEWAALARRSLKFCEML